MVYLFGHNGKQIARCQFSTICLTLLPKSLDSYVPLMYFLNSSHHGHVLPWYAFICMDCLSDLLTKPNVVLLEAFASLIKQRQL